MTPVLASSEQLLGIPGGAFVAIVGFGGVALAALLTRRSSVDTVAVQRDQATWQRMETLLRERDRENERLREEVKDRDGLIARLKRALRDAGLPIPD